MAEMGLNYLTEEVLTELMRQAVDNPPALYMRPKFRSIGPLYDVVDYNAAADRIDYATPTDFIWRGRSSPSDCVWMVPGTQRDYSSWMW